MFNWIINLLKNRKNIKNIKKKNRKNINSEISFDKERMVFKIPVRDISSKKAKKQVSDLIKEYKEEIKFDDKIREEIEEVKIKDKFHILHDKDYWFPKKKVD